MARGPRYRVPFRRRREGKTNYRKRLALLKSEKPRVVVRKTLTKTIVQVVEYHQDGDRIVASATSQELRKLGWTGSISNTPAAYLTGYIAAKRAIEKGLSEGVLDIGIAVPSKGSKVFGAAKGVVDAGYQIPLSDDVIPPEDRITGKAFGEAVEKQFQDIRSKLEA